MKNAMKDRNTDFHLAEASRNAWTSELPSFPPLLSFSVLSKTSCTSCLSWTSFWQLTTSFELIVLGQPLLSFSSGFGSRLGRVIKYVASSYTTRLETEQVLPSPNRRGGGGIWGEEELETLIETVLVACMVKCPLCGKAQSLQTVACTLNSFLTNITFNRLSQSD